MTPSKFIRIKEGDFELVLNTERLNSVIKTGEIVVIYHGDDSNPSRLNGTTAKVFWQWICGESICIYQDPPVNKNAEVSTQQDFSENDNS